MPTICQLSLNESLEGKGFLHDSNGYKYWTSRSRNAGFTGSNVRPPVVHKPKTSPARHAFSYKSSAASSTSSEHRPVSYNQQPRFVPSGRKALKMAQGGTRRLVTSIKRPLIPITKSRRPNRAIPSAVAAPSPCSSFSQCKCCRWTMSYKKTTKMCTKPKYTVKSVKFCVRKSNGMCLRTVNQKQRVPDGVESKPCVSSSGSRTCTACCPKIQLGYPCTLAKKQPRNSRHINKHDRNIQSEQRLGAGQEESQLEIKRRNQEEEEEKRKAEEELRREQERQGSRFPSGDGILDLRPDDELDEDATGLNTRLNPPVVVEPPSNTTGVNRGPQIDLPRRSDIPPNPDEEEEMESDDPSELCCGFEEDERKSCCMNKPDGFYQRCCPDPFADNARGDPAVSTPQNVRRLPTFQRSPEKGPPLCCSDSRQERYACCLRLPPGSPRNCCSPEHMELLRQDNRVSEFRAPPPQIRQRPSGEKGDPVCCSSNRQERYDCCMKLPANVNIQYSCCAPDHLAKIEQDIRRMDVEEVLPPVRPTPFPRYQELRAPETIRYFPVPQRNTEKGDPVCCSQDRRERYDCCLKLPPTVPYSCCSADQMEMLEQDMIKLDRPPVPSLPDRRFQELRAPSVSHYVPVPQRNTEKGDPVCCSQDRRERYECCKKLPPTVPYSCCSAPQLELIERDLERMEPIRIPPPTPYDPGFQEFRAPATSLVLPVPRHTEKGDPLCCSSTRRNRYDCCLKLPQNVPRHCCSAAHMERLKADLDMMDRHPDIAIRRPPPAPARLVSTGQNAVSQRTVERRHRRCCSKTRRQKKKCCFAYPISSKPACCDGVGLPESATPSSFYPFTSIPAFDFPNDQGYNSKGDTALKRNPGPFSGTERHPKFPPASSAALISSSHSDCCASSARVRDNCCSSTQLMGLQARCCPKLKKPLVSSQPSCCNLAPYVKVDCCADSKWTGKCCPVLG
ncbi:hypothetical protein LOTGIDRAFT_236812 [Lottia gigantea]|uniref:Uncharacterized protein n=1 Tax=Lottia gigantea TaxID=225164 RepID=V3ZLG3_LOTGI|nr:hypothetical protein LOTGIDRAFT_236812 [Lottia gigantea]ESO83235.1 hypothetical protein LOTGIDRAFT_236812 [Lottia gigantea]